MKEKIEQHLKSRDVVATFLALPHNVLRIIGEEDNIKWGFQLIQLPNILLIESIADPKNIFQSIKMGGDIMDDFFKLRTEGAPSILE